MTHRRRLALAIALATSAASQCADGPSAPFPPTTLTIKAGRSESAHGVKVAFDAVLSDSRCPIDVVCIHAGDAIAQFTVITKTARHAVELAVDDPDRRAARAGDVDIAFTALAPAPRSTQPIDSASYVATVTIAR